MILAPTTIEQINAWRAAESETEKLEFKEAKNQFGFNDLLANCVAMANERGGILLLGITNQPPRNVVGTKAYPSIARTKKDLLDKLHFRVDIEEVQHPDGRVLIFHIPSRPTGRPYHIGGAYYMRCGESLVPMTTDQLQQIFDEEMSSVSKAILYTATVFIVLVLFSFIYWVTRHSPVEVHPTTDEATAVGANPKQQSGSATQKPKNSLVTGSVDWHDKHDWRKYLRVGMTKEEVRRLFGEAEKVRVSENMETWEYGAGDITFFDGALYSWSEPDR